MAKLHTLFFIIIYAILCSQSIHSFLIEKKQADMLINNHRRKRANSDVFEELQQANFERECSEENCSQEEFNEWSGSNNRVMKKLSSINGNIMLKSFGSEKATKKDIEEATFNPCNSKFPNLLKNKFVCHKSGVQQCISSKQNEISFCRCKPNYKQCVDGDKCENNDPVRCKYLAEHCSNGFHWDRMGISCECNPINFRANGKTQPTKFSHLEGLFQNITIDINRDLHDRCTEQNPSYQFKQFYLDRGLKSPFMGKLCDRLQPEFNLHNLEKLSQCRPCGKGGFYFHSENRDDNIVRCQCPFVIFGSKKYELLHGQFCEKEISKQDFDEMCISGEVCGGFSCTGLDVSKLTGTGDLTRNITKHLDMNGCNCPYFINTPKKGTVTHKKLFSDKFCTESNEQQICLDFCGRGKTRSCSINIYNNLYPYKNSTNNDVTCQCRKDYEVNPKTGKCRKKVIKCGIVRDFTWKSNVFKGCNCPLIVGTHETAFTTRRATTGELCNERNSTAIDILCRKSCNTDMGNQCDLIADPDNRNYFLECTCIKPISRITGKSANLFSDTRCSEKPLKMKFCQKHCAQKNGKKVISCRLKKSIKVGKKIDKNNFSCKYKRTQTLSTTEKNTTMEMITRPSCWSPPAKCEWYWSLKTKKWYMPNNMVCQSPKLLFSPEFCHDHICYSGKCCFKNQLIREKYYNRYKFSRSDILCLR